MKEKIIVFDFDGTIALSNKLKIKQTRERYGRKISANQTTSERYPLGKKKYADMMKDLTHEHIMRFELDKDVSHLFKKLKLSGYKIFILTSRYENEERPELTAVKNFCKYYNLQIDGYYNTNEKSKYDIMKKLKPVIMVDDSFFKLEDLSKSKTTLLYIKRSWNDAVPSERIQTINRLKEVLKYV